MFADLEELVVLLLAEQLARDGRWGLVVLNIKCAISRVVDLF